MTPPVDLYFEQLQDAGERLRRTAYSRLKTDLNRYLKALAAHPLAARAIAELEDGADLQTWLDDLGDPFTGDPPDFPDDERRDAAIRLALARLFAKDIEEATNFGIRLSTANDYVTLIEAVTETVLHPLIDDLPELLLQAIQRLEQREAQGAGGVSATILTDPTHPRWAAILRILDTLTEALGATPGPLDQRQVRAEILAGTLLIRSGRVRPSAVSMLLTADDGPLQRTWPEPALAVLADQAVRLIETALETEAQVRP